MVLDQVPPEIGDLADVPEKPHRFRRRCTCREVGIAYHTYEDNRKKYPIWAKKVSEARQWADEARDGERYYRADPWNCIVNTEVIRSMPYQRLASRRFSLGACWLLSWLATGVMTTGACRMSVKSSSHA